MKLWKISQTKNGGWDTYDSAVVAAVSSSAARKIHPGMGWDSDGKGLRDWCNPKDVTVEYIGPAKRGIKPGVIVASFNAG